MREAAHRSYTTVPSRFGDRASNHKIPDSHRVLPLEATIARVMERADVIGLTRLADITDLDVLAIPNYAAICPELNYPPTEGGISVFSGKGPSKAHAKASALMEAVEHYSGVGRKRFAIRGDFTSLVRHHDVAHPSLFVVLDSWKYRDDEPLDWVLALSLFSGRPVLVPAFMVFTPYVPVDAITPPHCSSTNGLASGNTLEEAALHGLYETIERDAELLADYSPNVRTVDPDSLRSPALRDLVARFSRHHLQLQLKDITQDIPVHTFMAICVDWELRNIRYVNGGKGTHLDPETAMVRAITEASQSRVVGIAGIREDMPAKRAECITGDFDILYQTYRDWYEDSARRCRLDALPNLASESVVDDLNLVLGFLRKAGISDVYLVDLTRPELGIPVTRVLVPQLEFKQTGNWIGPRGSRYLAS